MAGYVRQSASEILAGQVVLATPLNAEFNQLQAAFHATTGHTHDASAGNGPKITLTTSVVGILPVANGGTGLVSVDNTVPRYNGTTGILQTSDVVIDDSNTIKTGSGSVTTVTSANQVQAVGATTVGLLLENTDNTGSGYITFGDGAIAGRIQYDHSINTMTFTTNASTSMTLSSAGSLSLTGNLSADGNVGAVEGLFSGNVATSADVLVGDFSIAGVSNGKQIDASVQDSSRSITGAASHYRFYNPNGLVGSISTNSSATTFSTSSDGRLKENLQAFDSGSFIDALSVYKFDWKAGGSGYGVIAQEAVEVFPDAVVLPEFEDDMLSVDYSKFVPLLLAEVKSLRTRVEYLEQKGVL